MSSTIFQKTNISIQATAHLYNNKDPTEEEDDEKLSNSYSDGNNDTDSDSETSQHWHDALEWNLDRVGQLRDILRIWVEGDIPADEIGDFLVSCLYRRDGHLGHRLTRMVDERETNAHIARVLIDCFQIRDDDDEPLWTQIRPGNLQRRPGYIHDVDADELQVCESECRADDSPSRVDAHVHVCTEKTAMVSHIVSPQPVRPIRWPLLLEDFEPEYLIQQTVNGGKIQDEGEMISMRYSKQNGLAILGNAERRALVHRPESDLDFECQIAEMTIHPVSPS